MIELGINRGPSRQLSKKETVAERVTKEESKERIKITESQFYHNHYQSIADKRNKAGRILAMTAEDVKAEWDKMREEDKKARDNPQFKEWKGGLDTVFNHVEAKKNDPDGEGKKYHIAILNIGGGMMGSKGAGNVAGLHELGFGPKLFDVLSGISAGIANLLYFAGGKLHTLRGAAIYYHQCASKKFINLLGRPWHVLKSSVITDAMKEGSQAIDEEAIRENTKEMLAAITPKGDPNMPTEWGDVLHSKPGMIPVVGASINVPILFAPGVKVNTGGGTVEYIDGAFGELPIEEIKERFPHITDIIVITNTHFERIEDLKPSGEWIKKIPRAGSLGTIRKFIQAADEKRKLLGYYKKEKGLNVGMLWAPKTTIHPLNNDPDEVLISYLDTIKDTIRQAGKNLPPTTEIYLPGEDKYLEIELGK